MTKEKETQKYDIFISHKQSSGAQLALIIKLLLEKNDKKKLNIFLDEENLDNIHNLNNFVKNSKNLLLLITKDVFKSKFVIGEIKSAKKYNVNIITLWDKDNCDEFPKKEELKILNDEDINVIKSILDIKAIPWTMQKNIRESAINDIIDYMDIGFNKLFNFIPKNEFKEIEIDEDITIKKLLETYKIKFNIGKVFYQVIKKEKIGTDKEIILIEKTTSNMYNGEYVREFLNLKPSTHTKGIHDIIELNKNLNYDVFIQSNSSGTRKIKKGCKVLCENINF